MSYPDAARDLTVAADLAECDGRDAEHLPKRIDRCFPDALVRKCILVAAT
jgi:hypothetical protein